MLLREFVMVANQVLESPTIPRLDRDKEKIDNVLINNFVEKID